MEENKDNIIEIRPVSKWKRFLAFLADFFIAFIIAFTLFNLATFPLAKLIFNTQKQSEQALVLERKATNLLINDGYLYSPAMDASFEDDVNYTFKVFLSYYAFDEETPESTKAQFGHKIENEVILKYYKNVIKDTDLYINDFKEINQEDEMFEIGSTLDEITLKSDYKTILANELLEVVNEDKYSATMTNFRDHVFAKLFYLKVYDHILTNDYVADGVSFKECLEESRDIMRSLQWIATGTALFTTLLAWAICFVIYPLINKDHKTIGLSAMHISKLNYRTLGPISRGSVMIQSFYQFVFLLSGNLFLPILFFGMSYIFNLPLLFVLSLISFILILVSGLFIITSGYNRSGADILTNIVLLPDSEIDMMYRVEVDHGE
ncbi:MAG: hypothetical protein MJ216_00775 [Bacilli bacterium]|nr:hypothetical protein [Bacilli bacterium]